MDRGGGSSVSWPLSDFDGVIVAESEECDICRSPGKASCSTRNKSDALAKDELWLNWPHIPTGGFGPANWVKSQPVAPEGEYETCLLYTSPSPRDGLLSRMPSSA